MESCIEITEMARKPSSCARPGARERCASWSVWVPPEGRRVSDHDAVGQAIVCDSEAAALAVAGEFPLRFCVITRRPVAGYVPVGALCMDGTRRRRMKSCARQRWYAARRAERFAKSAFRPGIHPQRAA